MLVLSLVSICVVSQPAPYMANTDDGGIQLAAYGNAPFAAPLQATS